MNELKSYTEYAVSTPTADFVIGFDFNYGDDTVNVTIDNVPASIAGYTVVYLNETTIRLSPSVPSGVVRLQRETDIDTTDNQFTAGAKFTAQTMDENFEQIRNSQQEVRDGFSKLKDDIGFTNLEQTVQAVHTIANEVEDNVVESRTLLEDTTAQAVLAQGYASTAESANTAAQQAATDAQQVVIDVSTAEADVYAALADQTQTVNTALSNLSTEANKFYPTLAEANVDIANIAVNQPVTIGEVVNGGLWYKATAEATTLTKSPHDPLIQAKIYTDAKYFDLDGDIGFFSNYQIQKSGQAFNGASIDAYKVSIPIGQTGINTYVQDYIDLGDTTSIAGKKITIIANFSTSVNLLSVMPHIRNLVSASRGGVISENVAVVGSTALNQIDATTIRVSADYIIVGSLSEKVALSFQVMNHGGNTTTTLREFQVKNTGIRFYDESVYSEISNTKTELNANIATVSNELADSSSVQVAEYKQTGQGQNGAVRTGDRIDIPVGQTGLNSYLRFVTPILNLESLNFKARLTAVLKTSDDYFSKFGNTNIRLAKYANYTDASPIESNAATSFKLNRIDKNTYKMYVDFDSTSGRKAYALWFQHTNTSDSSTARFVELEALYFNVLSADQPFKIAALTKAYQIETLKQRVTYLEAAISSLSNPTGYSRVVTVKPSGGDYTHPKLALDAITDARIDNKVMIAVYAGTYTGYAEWYTKDYVDIVGIGRQDDSVISYDSGDAADYNTVRNTSLCWMASESMFKNLTLKVKNGRYVIHLESNGNKEDVTCRIENCKVIHEGNATEAHWWSPSQYAVGSGLSAGQKVVLRGSYFAGRGGGFSWHTPNNRVAYTKPCSVDAESCVFENTRTSGRNEYPYAGAFSIKPICKGAADTTRLVGNKFINGKVYYSAGEWLDTADTTTNRAQIEVYGHGNIGFDFYAHELSYTPNLI